ncbi:MAG: Protein flightless like protein [Mucilaginibacter sp.]|nr:Protein flightless like protein [Mucilaginibacter sp.]
MSIQKKVRENLDKVKDHGWQVLDLKNCGLTEIPEEIFAYKDIISLDLSNDLFCEEKNKNRIEHIPNTIQSLKKVARINLENNLVKNLSDQLASLTNLKYLNLKNNRLTELSEKIANMSSLKELHLEGNPFEMLPPEILARGIESIRNFYKELEEKDYLYEVKLIIVGEGRVGKSCLTKALIEDDFCLEETESTEGININRWVIKKDEINTINPRIQRDFQINIWDFGGQEIYHSTHQFFLTKRSIYLLVTESRKEDSHDDFFYWLNIIKLLGDKSPVIMVLNKSDQPTKELPIKEYKDTFSNIIDFQRISLTTDHRKDFNVFKKRLKDFASKLPHIGNPLPKVWVDIRREIEELKLSGVNYITETEYLEICKKRYRNVQSALFLSEYFHDLGVLLHFQDDIELKDIVILNHEWITSGVYKILDDRIVLEQKGRFTNDDIKRIWSNDVYKYKIRELLSLMKNRKFDLCFELGNGEYLIPRLLPVDEIDHAWHHDSENLKFEFRYKFMPKGILARLIVKLSHDVVENKYWRYGVILQYDGTKAIIKEKYFESKLIIELAGTNKREFLFAIRKAIKEIHNDFNKLKVSEMIPCNCDHCSNVVQPAFYDYDLLKRYELNDIVEIRCPLSLDMVLVKELTSDVIKGQFSRERLIVCENKNADLLSECGFENILFFPERDSSSVFIKVKTKPENYGLRDRDFLTDSEIERIQNKYKNFLILEYYCFENYMFHPDNIEELNLANFNKSEYTAEIIKQKNLNKDHIISIYKNARNNYQEFKIESENLRDKNRENDIIHYLNSDDIEVLLKSYSLKTYFNKALINKYNLKPSELSNTAWFKLKMNKVFKFE